MRGRTKSCDVKGGRIHVVCSRCKSIRYVPVSTTNRRKMVRCKCGKVSSYILNHRGFMRESISGQALATAGKGVVMRAQLRDVSPTGLGFTVKSGQSRRLRIGQELEIKYRVASGAMVTRKVRLQNIAGSRIGAEFIDSMAAMMRRTL